MLDRIRKRLSVRTRLALWNAGVLGIALLALGIAVRVAVYAYVQSSVDRELESRAFYFRLALSTWVPPPDRGDFRSFTNDHVRPPSTIQHDDPYRPQYFDRSGRQMDQQREVRPWDTKTLKRAMAGETVFITLEREGERLRLCSTPVHGRDHQVAGVIQVPVRLTDIERGLAAVDQTLLTLLPLALLVTASGSALLTNRAIRPIEQALEQEKRFVADASHELRTPIAIIRAAVELGMEALPESEEANEELQAVHRMMERVNIASDRSRRIVEDLLLLARAEGNASLQQKSLSLIRRPTRAFTLLEEAALLFEPVRGERQIRVDVTPPYIQVNVDCHHFGRVLSNLIDNAVRHTDPVEGRIVLMARIVGRNRVELIVRDNGEGIPASDLPHLFRRFYRADSARSRRGGGTGLGLAIAQAIVTAHNGSISIESVPGLGTSVRIVLPAA